MDCDTGFEQCVLAWEWELQASLPSGRHDPHARQHRRRRTFEMNIAASTSDIGTNRCFELRKIIYFQTILIVKVFHDLRCTRSLLAQRAQARSDKPSLLNPHSRPLTRHHADCIPHDIHTEVTSNVGDSRKGRQILNCFFH